MENLTNRDYFGYTTTEEDMREYIADIEEAYENVVRERNLLRDKLIPIHPSKFQFEDEEYETEEDEEIGREQDDLISFRGKVKKQGTLRDRIAERESKGDMPKPKKIPILKPKGPTKRPTGKTRFRNRYLQRARYMYEERQEEEERKRTNP